MVDPLSRDIETASTTMFEGLMTGCENTLQRTSELDLGAYNQASVILLIIWLGVFREFHFVLVPVASPRIYSYPQSYLGIFLSLGDRT
jgi:hypothetical protein